MNITILGGGSWGTALAVHLAKNNHQIKIWEFMKVQADEMQNQRICKLLPEIKLPENIFVSSNMQEVFVNSELVLLVVPSDFVESTIEQSKQFIESQPIIICSKGFGKDNKLLSDIVKERVSGQVYCLYGPTHAEEVCKGMFSGIVLAGGEGKENIQKVFESNLFKVDLSDDLIGVQVASALKNIIAIFIGVLDGLKLGDNAKAYFIVKGLEELRHVGLAMGGQEETFHGLAGMGDIIVTSLSKHSRNRYVGEEIGKGRKLDEIVNEMNMVAEGVTTIKSAIKLKIIFGLELPLITKLHEVIFNGEGAVNLLEKI
jgi:glycerol-3-phosphate dehydrogenase (NAD(P)+)